MCKDLTSARQALTHMMWLKHCRHAGGWPIGLSSVLPHERRAPLAFNFDSSAAVDACAHWYAGLQRMLWPQPHGLRCTSRTTILQG